MAAILGIKIMLLPTLSSPCASGASASPAIAIFALHFICSAAASNLMHEKTSHTVWTLVFRWEGLPIYNVPSTVQADDRGARPPTFLVSMDLCMGIRQNGRRVWAHGHMHMHMHMPAERSFRKPSHRALEHCRPRHGSLVCGSSSHMGFATSFQAGHLLLACPPVTCVPTKKNAQPQRL